MKGKILTILLAIFLVFWIVYGLYDPFKLTVNNFISNAVGPTIYGSVAAVTQGILTQIGLGGFAAMTLGIGAIAGIIMHYGWVKADWRLRRWGSERISRDLGTQPISNIPSTPVGATTRPAVAPAPTVTASTPQPTQEATTTNPTPKQES